ncbi:pentapeptide repeat-containing protein [Colwellia sp. TT2012]|uniref:pentapeptide repeat-containing protein n=1 Tax=Colwellia sp. TT2012 TaxID=1720342 RepID=UPI00070E1C52|nr:pentapeptide repeat-containing protein [Colwellia sp. TT2012]
MIVAQNIKESVSGEFHLKLMDKGRDPWNRWAITVLADDKLSDIEGIFSELRPYSVEELTELYTSLGLKQHQELAVDASFKGLEGLNVNFTHCLFPGEVNFENVQFNGFISFDKAQFCSIANFKGAQFSDGAYFGNVQFCSIANFEKTQFCSLAYFKDAQFSGGAYFKDAEFSRVANFINAKFSTGANFLNAKFSDNVNFSKAQFNELAYFDDAQFSKNVDFEKTQFSGIASFEKTQFNEGAFFVKAKFSKDAFTNDVNFKHAQFSGDVDFQNVEFGGSANFKNAKFIKNADFNHVDFTSKTDFSYATFNFPPRFHETNINQGTSFYQVQWPTVSSEPHLDKDAWRTLKQAMNKVQDHEQELMFFGFEMDAKINTGKQEIKELNKGKWWGTYRQKQGIRAYIIGLWCYKFFSGYGTSLWRPLSLLVVTWFIFAVLYSLPGWGIPATPWLEGFQLSWGNMLPFASMTKTALATIGFDKDNPLGLCLQIVTSFQNFVSTILLFLIGLAAKHRLSIK